MGGGGGGPRQTLHTWPGSSGCKSSLQAKVRSPSPKQNQTLALPLRTPHSAILDLPRRLPQLFGQLAARGAVSLHACAFNFGRPRASGLLHGLTEADLHVINYSQLRLLGESLSPVHWQAVTLDRRPLRQKQESPFTDRATRLALGRAPPSSSPAPPSKTGLMDLWSLMALPCPGPGQPGQFARTILQGRSLFPSPPLLPRVRPFLLRRTKPRSPKTPDSLFEEDWLWLNLSEHKLLYRAS